MIKSRTIRQMIDDCLKLRQLRFLVVGGFNTLVSYLFFLLAEAIFGYQAALIVTYVIGINISIFTMRYWVFQSCIPLRKQYIKAASTYILMLLCNYIFLYLAVDCAGGKSWAAQAFFTVISTTALYFLHKEINFKAHIFC